MAKFFRYKDGVWSSSTEIVESRLPADLKIPDDVRAVKFFDQADVGGKRELINPSRMIFLKGRLHRSEVDEKIIIFRDGISTLFERGNAILLSA